MVLLFLDLLGVRRLWHEGGREAAEAAFHRFRKTIEEALRGEEGNAVIGGSIETDAAAIVCDTPDVAIRVALRLYRSVFIRAKKRGDERMWLRGAITDCGKECTLRTATAFNSSLTQVEVVTYSPALLDASQARHNLPASLDVWQAAHAWMASQKGLRRPPPMVLPTRLLDAAQWTTLMQPYRDHKDGAPWLPPAMTLAAFATLDSDMADLARRAGVSSWLFT